MFHTFFGVAGLSLMGYEGLKPIDPMYALPADVVSRVFEGRQRTYPVQQPARGGAGAAR